MKKIKYYYNTNTLRYEKLETPLRVKLLRIFGFIAAAFVTATIISFVAFRFIGSPDEKLLRNQNERMRDRYNQRITKNDMIRACLTIGLRDWEENNLTSELVYLLTSK